MYGSTKSPFDADIYPSPPQKGSPFGAYPIYCAQVILDSTNFVPTTWDRFHETCLFYNVKGTSYSQLSHIYNETCLELLQFTVHKLYSTLPYQFFPFLSSIFFGFFQATINTSFCTSFCPILPIDVAEINIKPLEMSG